MTEKHAPQDASERREPLGPPAGESAAQHRPDGDPFFCPVYEGLIDRYGCSEICCGVKLGWIPNDGVPPLMAMADILEKAHLCRDCPRHK